MSRQLIWVALGVEKSEVTGPKYFRKSLSRDIRYVLSRSNLSVPGCHPLSCIKQCFLMFCEGEICFQVFNSLTFNIQIT